MRPGGRAPLFRAGAARDVTLTVSRMGADGDGLAALPEGGFAAVAFTLPGEVVTARIAPAPGKTVRADLLDIVTPSPSRITPPCVHFGKCGGCALQHWEDQDYAAWKRARVVEALARAGFANPIVHPLARTRPHTRRRMDLAIGREQGKLVLGLHRAHAKTITDIEGCVVLHPSLLELLAPLRTCLASLAAIRATGSVVANLLDTGPDLLIRTDGDLSTPDRTRLAAFAQAHTIPRIAWAKLQGPPENAAQLASPYVIFADRRVEPPPGAFLQASVEGESAIVSAVLAGLPVALTAKAHAIELYAGCGTISLPLSKMLRVVAYEGDAAATAALSLASSGGRIDVRTRDLVRQPLSVKEFAGASCIVLDPPYAGAAMQMPAIAASGVGRVIYVSCNPDALARDAAALHAAGYELVDAMPIDQFLWSGHVECVGVFRKK